LIEFTRLADLIIFTECTVYTRDRVDTVDRVDLVDNFDRVVMVTDNRVDKFEIFKS